MPYAWSRPSWEAERQGYEHALKVSAANGDCMCCNGSSAATATAHSHNRHWQPMHTCRSDWVEVLMTELGYWCLVLLFPATVQG
jgi:hypothetical protein